MRRAIFVGYRRTDAGDAAERVCEALGFAFGERFVFRGVDNLPPGADFADIKLQLRKCRVFLAFIGPDWLDARDATGARCLDDPTDLLRIEIERALATPKLVVAPVLVDGAQMPSKGELPASLRGLVRKRAAIMRRDPDFRTDLTGLVEALREQLRTGRLDMRSLDGAARVSANADWISALVAAGCLVMAGVGMAAPEVREPVMLAGAKMLDAMTRQLASMQHATAPNTPVQLAEPIMAPPPGSDQAQLQSTEEAQVEPMSLPEGEQVAEAQRRLGADGEERPLLGGAGSQRQIDLRRQAEGERQLRVYPAAVRAAVQSAEAAEQNGTQAAARARNREHGTAVVDFDDGARWEGQVDANGNPAGAGVYTTDRARYYGQWSQGGADGYGVLYERIAYDAKRYAGEWRSGVRGGIGASYWAGDDVIVCAGVWEGARLITAIGPQIDTPECP